MFQNKDTSKVYTRKRFRAQVETIDSDPTSTSEPCSSTPVHENEPEVIDVTSASRVDVENASLDDLPIALRKSTRAKAGVPPSRYGYEHDISKYVSYASLSPAYRAFIASLQSIQIPRDWKEAKQDPKWCDAMMEELRALEKNKTWDIVKLPARKKAVSCKWILKGS
jgi:hypothetical protein